ncbi:MAG: tripartite tricarboxylate transporter substrate binding protein [Rhodoferax sp.]|nr:tripartite tricarboxylate transporter substrate binding protein [Rhodoferax sp.]
MKNLISRRTVLAAAAALCAMPVMAQTAFPSQTIKIIVPYPAGGATDILARMVAQKLQDAWNNPVVVENKPGAGGTIGNNAVAKAAPDGHTILMAITAIVQQPTLMTLPYDPIKDFAPVTQIAKSPSMFAVPLNSPAKSLKEFVTLVKASPGQFNFGTYGAGTSSHIQGSLLNLQAGLDMVHVPFQGAAPLVTNMVGGQLTSAFIDSASARAHIKSFRPLAVTGTQRMPSLPDVPTFKELGYHSYEPIGWFGMFLPASTSAAVVNKFSEEVNRILRLPDVVTRIEGLGLWVGGGKPEEFAQTVKSDAGVYAKIIKDANIKISQ